jgi:uncharacterized protein YfaQ (DUF2300 family)
VSARETQADRVQRAANAAWDRYRKTRKLPAFWPELNLLAPNERAAVKEAVRDLAVWRATAPNAGDPLSNTRHGAAR